MLKSIIDKSITGSGLLAEHCSYDELQDNMIRDLIVVGLQDATLTEKLQLKLKLTLELVIAKVRQTELIKNNNNT